MIPETKLLWRDVFKDPITDPGKVSKKGRVTLWGYNGRYETAVTRPGDAWEEVLRPVYKNGKLLVDMIFDEVRANARK